MSYDTEKVRLGREPVVMCGIVADYCSLIANSTVSNLAQYTEDFDNAYWSLFKSSLSTNMAKDPFDNYNAELLIPDTSSDVGRGVYRLAITVTNAVSYTYSVYAKSGGYGGLQIAGHNDDTTQFRACFNLDTGAVHSTGSSATSAISDEDDGWYRCSITVTSDDTTADFRIYACPIANLDASGGVTTYTGDGISGIYIFGAQMEQSSSVTEYHKVNATPTCTATETGDNKCFNTRATCNATTLYTRSSKEYIFSEPRSVLPVGETIYPLIDGKINKAGTSTTAGSGLGKRAVVSVKLKDMAHHDRGIDPYVSTRTYTPESQGTFWGKWLKRNPYYEGRTLKVYYGYLGETFSWNDFEVQEYDITDIAGVNNGYVTITAKDVLVRTYDRKSQYPAASEGELLAGITAGATSATLTPTGIGNSDYPASGTVSIGKEAMSFTRSVDVLTLTRAQWGTTAVAHNAGDTVQICATWDGTPSTDNVTDVLYELLVPGAGLPSSYIPTTDWDTEQDLWLSSATVKGILMKPESIEKVIAELSESFMFDIWWDATVQEVKIKALSPEPSGVTINTLSEGNHIKQGSLKIDRRSNERFTEIRCYYNKIDYSEDNKPEKFASLQIASDASRAGADRYDGNQIKTITSRWFEAGANAAQYTGRTLARFADTPEYVTFLLDNKDDGQMEMAGRLEIDSWQFQDATGATEARKFQVLEINEKDIGHDFEVKCLTSSFTGRYGFIVADGTVDYSSATEAQKESGMWICQADGTFSDGTEGYKII